MSQVTGNGKYVRNACARARARVECHTCRYPLPGTPATSDRLRTTVPRIALTKAEAALSIGVSVDYFEQHVQPDLEVASSIPAAIGAHPGCVDDRGLN